MEITIYYPFIAVFLTSCRADARVQKYITYTGPGLIKGELLHNAFAQSGLECLTTCSDINTAMHCDAASYHAESRTCELLSRDPEGSEDWGDNPGWTMYFSQASSCGAGWFEYSSSCYQPFTTGTNNWPTVRQLCIDKSAHLAVITNFDEHFFLVDVLNWLNVDTDMFWLGANDDIVEGTFVWETAETFNFNRYAPGKPNDGTDFNCIGMRESHWYDNRCGTPFYHVCERDLK